MIKPIYIYITFFIFFVKIGDSFSQSYTRANNWKSYRKEVVFQIGASQFLGDLGGLNKVGTDFSPVDLRRDIIRSGSAVA